MARRSDRAFQHLSPALKPWADDVCSFQKVCQIRVGTGLEYEWDVGCLCSSTQMGVFDTCATCVEDAPDEEASTAGGMGAIVQGSFVLSFSLFI